MTFKLRIWYKNHTHKDLKTEYDTITDARRVAYAKVKEQPAIEFIEVIEGYTIRGTVHWANLFEWRLPSNYKGKMVFDTSGELNDVGWYLNPDGTTAGQTPQYKRYIRYKAKR